MKQPKEVITIMNMREVGMWGDSPLYKGTVSNWPGKQDGEQHFTLVDQAGKRFIRIRDFDGTNERLVEVVIK